MYTTHKSVWGRLLSHYLIMYRAIEEKKTDSNVKYKHTYQNIKRNLVITNCEGVKP